MSDWLNDLQEAQRQLINIEDRLFQTAYHLREAGIAESLAERLMLIGYDIRETNQLVSNGTNGVLDEMLATSRGHIATVLTAALEAVGEDSGDKKRADDERGDDHGS